MAYSRIVKIGDGVTNQFSVTFPIGYLSGTNVTARVGTEIDGAGAPLYRTITFLSDTLLQISGTVPGNGVEVVFEITTKKDGLVANYQDGDVMDEVNLDRSYKQAVLLIHEILDGRIDRLAYDLDAQNHRIKRVANPVNGTDAANRNFVESQVADLAANTITLDTSNRWDAKGKRIYYVADPLQALDAANRRFVTAQDDLIRVIADDASATAAAASLSSSTAVSAVAALAAIVDDVAYETQAIPSRAVLATLAQTTTLPAGRVYRTEGLDYLSKTGATAIADMPGLLPYGEVCVQHFGAVANMTYALQRVRQSNGGLTTSSGFVRTGGTDQHSKIKAADDYCFSVGKPLWFKDGKYYIYKELEFRTRWLAESDFGVTLWLHYNTKVHMSTTRWESGLHTKTSGAGIGLPGSNGMRLIGQCDNDGVKSSYERGGQGAAGTLIRINEFMTSWDQPILEGMFLRVLGVRAAEQRDATGAFTQRSRTSIMFAMMAGIEQPHYQIGVWGQGHVRSETCFLQHFGIKYDPTTIRVVGADVLTGGQYASTPTVVVTGGGSGVTVPAVFTAIRDATTGAITSLLLEDEGTGYTERPTLSFTGGGAVTPATAYCYYGDAESAAKVTALPIDTYHTLGSKLEFITKLDNADGHGFFSPYDLASTGETTVLGVQTLNFNNTVANTFGGGLGSVSCGDFADHYTVASQKGRVGRGIRIVAPSTKNFRTTVAGEAFSIKGLGSARGSGDFKPGTREYMQRQLRMDVEISDALVDWHPDQDPQIGRGMYAYYIYGGIRFPNFRSNGVERAVEIEYSRGLFEGTVGGDGAVLNNFSDDIRFERVSTDRRNAQNGDDVGSYAFGYGSPNSRAIEIVGSDMVNVGTTNADFSSGTVPLAVGLPSGIRIGDTVWVGGQRLKCLAYAGIGQNQISVSPPIGTIVSGTVVYTGRRAKSSRIKADFRSSFYGIRAVDADVLDVDLSGVAYTGRHAIYASGKSTVEIKGGELPSVGRAGGDIANIYTIRCEDTTTLIMRGVRVHKNLNIQRHISLVGASTAIIEGCMIEDVASFMTISSGGDARVEWMGNSDFNGAILSHPYRSGSNANGDWVKHPDGTMECSIRYLAISANGSTWTFPQGFADGGKVKLFVTPANTTPRFIRATNSNAGSGVINLFDIAGAAISGNCSLRAIGTWR